MDGMADKDETKWLRRRITRLDEALPEAYIKTDYSKLTDKDFEKTLKNMHFISIWKKMDYWRDKMVSNQKL